VAEFTAKRARQHCRRSLARIDAMLVRMARHWDDLDHTVIFEIDNQRDALKELTVAMDDAVEYAAERDDG
jgi:hypothetical protein